MHCHGYLSGLPLTTAERITIQLAQLDTPAKLYSALVHGEITVESEVAVRLMLKCMMPESEQILLGNAPEPKLEWTIPTAVFLSVLAWFIIIWFIFDVLLSSGNAR